MPTTAPRFSVIVPVHYRKQFLSTAIESLRAQTLAPEEFEILVVKNFRDAAIERFLADHDVRVVETEAGPLGAKLALGLAHARGEVITFLEDDDRYAPDRLAVIADRFDRDPDLGYFHNSVRLIDRDGRPIHSRFRAETARPGRLGAHERAPRAVRRFLRVSPYFNLSSTAIHRRALEGARSFLSRTNLTCDNLVFYAALAAPLSLYNEPSPLTYYRLHPSASWSPGADEEFLASERRRTLEVVEGFGLIAEMLAGGPVERFARADLLEQRAKLTLTLADRSERLTWRDIARLFATRGGRREMRRSWLALALLLRRMTPQLEQRLYVRYVRWRSAQLGVG